MKKIVTKIYELRVYILLLIITCSIFMVKIPYYIDAPGSTINITDRIQTEEAKKTNGTINMLYVSEYEGTIATYTLAKVLKNWDISKVSDYQVSNENVDDISERNKLMLKNSFQNATFVAYHAANKKIKINGEEISVIATIIENDLEIGDVILKVENKNVETVNDIKEIITSHEVGDYISFRIRRNNKEQDIKCQVKNQDNRKIIGAVFLTNYDYDLDPKIEMKFKNSESGSSGGLMMALTIYNAISDEDIIKGRNIGGTGAIDLEGNVSEIDGIKYKIIGAARNKLDLVFVPSANYSDAIKVKKENNYNLDIVKVDTFAEALDYLRR